jgi:hypothetical protein
MTLSLPGLIGALVGGMVGMLDFGLVVAILRRAREKADPMSARPSDTGSRQRILKVAFGLNLVVFAGLGYWFGVAMTG